MYWPEGESLDETAARLAEMVRASQMLQRLHARAEADGRRNWVRADLWMEDHAPSPNPRNGYADPTRLSPELQAQKERNARLRQQRGLPPI